MNRFGRIFGVELFGESHGKQVGVVIDGCPPGIPLTEIDLEPDLARRRAGLDGTTPRREHDIPSILSGVYQGYTTGSPILIAFPNNDTRSVDYRQFTSIPRPGHADFCALRKYGGFSDPRGSGHFSGRITVGLVAAGTIAKKTLSFASFETRILEAGGSPDVSRIVRQAQESGDSVGALVQVTVRGIPAGLGEPFFDACESVISHAVFAVPGIRGIEFGDGFAAAKMYGHEHNDPILDASGKTSKNGAGGINGGISNSNPIVFRAAVKPTSSIALPQETFDFSSQTLTRLEIEGRHDACIALRSAVVIESAAAIALADLYLAARAVSVLA